MTYEQFERLIKTLLMVIGILYIVSIPILLYGIFQAIVHQTKYLKDEEEIQNIGNN